MFCLICSPGKMFGGFLAQLITWRRKFLILTLFLIISTFITFHCIYPDLSYILGGFTLFFGYFLYVVLNFFAYQYYEEYLNDKAIRALNFGYYLSGALAFIIFENFYRISFLASTITSAAFALIGIIACLFLHS